jgi:sulfide:quinone oxidoreductase
MPVKCGGAPQKIMYLSEETFRKNDVRNKTDLHFYTSVGNLFPNCAKYAAALKPIAAEKGVNVHFQHILTAVDAGNREATMKNLTTDENVTVPFDLLHIVPPQTAPSFVRDSPLAAANGWLDVDHSSLQHNKYKNIFGLGDICNLPTAKTAAAVFV